MNDTTLHEYLTGVELADRASEMAWDGLVDDIYELADPAEYLAQIATIWQSRETPEEKYALISDILDKIVDKRTAYWIERNCE